ncbi:MAG: efflux RND transporter permease subunit [Deltaproteobacteria bacterium]|nr:efflux RND transporter permease subunit [Deltaproteobacteria bacterium]MBP7289372.1 efflux RND transporter permease subunit [Nannocystaceae bacterium]
MRALLSLCLRQRVVVAALAVLLMLVGIDAARTARIDAFPEFAPPKVEIQTEAPGLSSVEVETLVTRPLEDALGGTPLVATLRSKSVLGLSSVLVLFEPGTDLFRARQLVQERVALAQPNLPAHARAPVVLSPTSSTSRVLKIGLSSPTLSRLALSDLARWTLRPRLMAIAGVANVAVWGEARRELQIEVAPERLRLLGLRLADVTAAATAAVNPASGGFVDGPNQRLAVSHPAAVDGVETLADAPVPIAGGGVRRLGEVAEVVEGHAPLVGDAVIDAGSGLLLIVEKQPWGNTVAITDAIDAALTELAPALGDVRVDATIFRPARFIERAVDNLEVALAIGCALVVLVLILALLEWRTALISVLAIPLSLLGALAVLHHAGSTLDTMVLAGLSIALGEVVDDAIIDVENIHRRLRENASAATPRSAFAVVLSASIEVRSAVVFASVIVVLVFLPVYLLPGLAGAFFRPLALAYVLAVGSSLLVALTVTPALALMLLPRARLRAPAPRARFEALCAAMLRRRRGILAGALVALVAGGFGMARLGSGFLPDFREQDFLMHWIAKPGTSVEALRRTTMRVMPELLAIPGVRNAGAHLGRAEVSDEVVGPNFGEIWVSVDEGADHATTTAAIARTLAPYAGIYHDVQTYLRERVDEVLSGGHAQLVVRVSGPDLAVLDERAHAIARELQALAGVAEVSVEALTPVPQIEVTPRQAAAGRFGLTHADIRMQVGTMLAGVRVGEVYRSLRPVAVVVWGEPLLRTEPTALADLLLETPTGARVRLGEVADVAVVATPGAIKHEGGARRIDVAVHPDGTRAQGEVAASIEAVLAATSFPTAHHAALLGEAAAQRDATWALFVGGALAVLGIVLVLYADFGALRPTLLVAATLPFATVGAVAGSHLQGGVLSLGSLVGFVTVLGIAARNGIMLVSHYRHLELHEGLAFGSALVIRGTAERLSPILMTAFATGLALVPLVVLGDRPGQEIEHPMAVVILGGLVTSTLLNLVVTPAAYLGFGRGARAFAEPQR